MWRRLAVAVLFVVVITSSPNASLEARSVRPAPVLQVEETMPDSACGTARTCLDLRTGTPFSYLTHRIDSAGAIDTSWVADSASACPGTMLGMASEGVPDGTGGTLFAWVDSRSGGTEVFVTRLLASGERAEGWLDEGLRVCESTRRQSQVSVAPDGSGGAFVAWQEHRAPGDADVYLQHITSGGAVAAGWPADGLPLGVRPGEQAEPRLASDGNGGVFVTWLSREQVLAEAATLRGLGAGRSRQATESMGVRPADGVLPLEQAVESPSRLGLYVARVTAAGTISAGWSGQGFRVAEVATGSRCVADGDGGLFVAWWQPGDSPWELRLNRVSASATVVEGWELGGLTVSASVSRISDLVIHPGSNGSVFVVWIDDPSGLGQLKATRILNTGQTASGWEAGGKVIRAASATGTPAAMADSAGNLTLAWEDIAGGNRDILVSRVGSEGQSAGWSGDGVRACDANGDQYRPILRPDGEGGVLVTWSDADIDAMAAVAGARRSASALIELQEVVAMPKFVSIRWAVSLISAASIHLYRSDDGGDWTYLSELTPANGTMAFQDRGVRAGQTANYRLGVLRGDIEYVQPPFSVDVPLAPTTLEMSRVRAIPGSQMIHVTVAVPGTSPVKLELLDIAGRRVAFQRLSGLEVGEHDLRLPTPGLAPGVYFLRVSQVSQFRSTKFVYLR